MLAGRSLRASATSSTSCRASVLEGPLGTCFVAESELALDHHHGDEALGRFFELTDRGLGCLARLVEPLAIDRESILFLDTETTGLSGGTGTYVFMVGLAYFRGDRLLVRQYFMRDHAEEPAMLAALSQVFARHEAVVTFNGKSFDVPLLLTRYTANRQRPSVPTEIHLDLLHPSRRFWREQLESCTLGTLERAVLGHSRRYDVPSWMIPDLYFRYLRGDDPREMVAVFEHNLHDVLSLVALTCRLGRLLDGPAVADPAEAVPSVFELFAAARIYEDLGLLEEAYARYEQALLARARRGGAGQGGESAGGALQAGRPPRAGGPALEAPRRPRADRLRAVRGACQALRAPPARLRRRDQRGRGGAGRLGAAGAAPPARRRRRARRPGAPAGPAAREAPARRPLTSRVPPPETASVYFPRLDELSVNDPTRRARPR